MSELERRAVTRFGLSPDEFWHSTPKELEYRMEAFAYQVQLELNNTRHIMAMIANSVTDKKKRPQGYSAEDMMSLPLIDGKTEEQKKEGLAKAKAGLEYFKQRFGKDD